MDEKRLQEIEALVARHGNAANPDGLVSELVAEVRRLQNAQQEHWSDGFAAGEQSNIDVARLTAGEAAERLLASLGSLCPLNPTQLALLTEILARPGA